MRRYLVIGDIHYSQFSSIAKQRGSKYSIRLENLIECLNWVEEMGIKYNVDSEIFLGDVFDRTTINCEEITAMQDINWNKIPKKIVVGNHESNVMDLSYSTTKVLENIGAMIIDQDLTEEINPLVNFTYIPYIAMRDTQRVSDHLKDKSKRNVVFAHADLANVQYGKSKSLTGFDVEDIQENCCLFIDGHIHSGQDGVKSGDNFYNKVLLVGNLTGQNFTEDAFRNPHRICLITVNDDGSIIKDDLYVPEPFNFYSVYIQNDKDLSQLDLLGVNSFVSLRCSSNMVDKSLKKISSLTNVLNYRLSIIYYSKNDSDEDSIDFKVNDHIKLFVDLSKSILGESEILSDELSKL